MGIEPTLAAWEAAVLPLNYTRAGGRILEDSLDGTQIGVGRALSIGSRRLTQAVGVYWHGVPRSQECVPFEHWEPWQG
jgi:hypothetical protein